MRPLKLGSLFDGIGGFLLAANLANIEPVWASEIEAAPIAVTRRHFPEVRHLGDVTKINGAEVEPVDVLTFGSPCFPAGTLVLTANGHTPIEKVAVGDLVLTHTGRWQRVLRTGGKVAETIILKGFGHPGLETTKEHPFYASTKERKWRSRPTRGWDSFMSEPTWVEAQDMNGRFWATPLTAQTLPVPPIIADTKRGHSAPSMDGHFWWFVGYWLGNGWVRTTQRPNRPIGQTWGQIFVCTGHHKADALVEQLSKTGWHWTRQAERTVTRFRYGHHSLVKWLVSEFGSYAHGKRIPAWVLTLSVEHRTALFEGYCASDGWTRADGTISATTTSKQLALGMRLVGESLGYACPVYANEMAAVGVIEGREVNQRDSYTVRFAPMRPGSSRMEAHGHAWGLVREVSPGRRNVPVYNLEVEEDNSYVVENIVVHNCQDLSVAGNRKGLGWARKFWVKSAPVGWRFSEHTPDAETRSLVRYTIGFRKGTRSGLFKEAVRIIREMQEATKDGPEGQKPALAVWENVPGAFSSNAGRDFAAVLQSLVGGTVDVPRGGWSNAGVAFGPQGQAAWRVVDAQFWGVPQRRRRIILVYDPRTERAGQILFESYRLSGDSAKGQETGQGVARSPEDSPGTGGEPDGFGLIGNSEYRPGRVAPLRAEGGDCGGAVRPSSSVHAIGLGSYPLSSEGVAQPITGRNGDPGCIAFENRFDEGVRLMGDVCHTLRGKETGGGHHDFMVAQPVAFSCKDSGQDAGEVSPTLRAMNHDQSRPNGGGQVAVIQPLPEPACFYESGQGWFTEGDGNLRVGGGGTPPNTVVEPIAIQSGMIGRNDEAGPAGTEVKTDGVMYTLDAQSTAHGIAFAVKTNQTGANGSDVAEEAAFGLNATDKQAVSYSVDVRNLYTNEEKRGTLQSKTTGGYSLNYQNPVLVPAQSCDFRSGTELEDVSATLQSCSKGYAFHSQPPVRIGYIVRRLTPLEAERLQGNPDAWTEWGMDEQGNRVNLSDTARYKALGNGIAQPPFVWLMKRIAQVLKPGV